MIESTVVFTHYALLLTAATCLFLGALLGWAIISYLKGKQIGSLQSELKTVQDRLAEKSAKAGNTVAPATSGASSLHKKKDRLLKDFMKKQLKQKKLLEKANAEIKELQNAKFKAESSLNAAHTSLDQWKEKCVALAQARTKNKPVGAEVAKQGKTIRSATNVATRITDSKVKSSAATTFKLSPINITSSAKPNVNSLAEAPVEKATVTSAASKIPTDTPVDESLAAEVLTPVKKGSKKVAAQKVQQTEIPNNRPATKKPTRKPGNTITKLTAINGIGPAIEKELKKLGIKSIPQLAALKPAEANKIDKDLGKFSGRMNRQEWVKQARKLATQEQTESVAA